MRHITFLVILSLIVLTSTIFSAGMLSEFSKNPVFRPVQGQQAKNPCVVYDQSGFESTNPAASYKMWFATEDGIALAYSNDGLVWTEYDYSRPLSGLQAAADLPYVIYDKNGFGGTNYHYRIWYWSGVSDSIEGIRTAESIDGIVWENDRPIQQHPGDESLQLVTNPGVYDGYFHYCYGPGSILYNPNGKDIGSTTPTDKSDDQPMTYHYIMYYNSSSDGLLPEGSTMQTSLAYSVDGIYWIRYGDKPVISPYGNIKRQSAKNYYNARIIQTDTGYMIWYANSESPIRATLIGTAVSTDGMDWVIERTTRLNLKITSNSNLNTPLGYSVIQKMRGEKIFYGMWASITEETGKSSVNYYEIDLGKQNEPKGGSYWSGETVGYAPFNAHFEYQSTYCDFQCISGEGEVWHWDFGDGNSMEGELLWGVNHTYQKPGEYLLSVNVSCDGRLCEGEQHTIYVKTPGDTNPCGEPKGINVDKCSGYAPFPFIAWVKREEMNGCLYYNSDTYWLWDFGDGAVQEGWDVWTTTHTYTKAGIYTITATGFCDYDKQAFSDTQIIAVNEPTVPIPGFSVQQESAFAPTIVHFDTSYTQIPSSFTIASYLFNFGDGQQTSNVNQFMNHEYSNPGRYTVILQITDSTGKKYSFSQTIVIKGLFAPTSITLEKDVNRSLFSATAQNKLKWSPNSLIFECTVVKYNIYRKLASQSDSSYQLIGSVDGNTFTFTDTNIELKSAYSYVLTAVESGGHESPYSSPVSN
jgi:PKD repeat protein